MDGGIASTPWWCAYFCPPPVEARRNVWIATKPSTTSNFTPTNSPAIKQFYNRVFGWEFEIMVLITPASKMAGSLAALPWDRSRRVQDRWSSSTRGSLLDRKTNQRGGRQNNQEHLPVSRRIALPLQRSGWKRTGRMDGKRSLTTRPQERAWGRTHRYWPRQSGSGRTCLPAATSGRYTSSPARTAGGRAR